jgi:hypothetical protein
VQGVVRSGTRVAEKQGSRRSRLSMGPLIGNSQTQLLWSHSELSLTVANEGAHTLGTFEKHPHLGGQSPPSGTFFACGGTAGVQKPAAASAYLAFKMRRFLTGSLNLGHFKPPLVELTQAPDVPVVRVGQNRIYTPYVW